MLLQTPRHHLIRDPNSDSTVLIIESHTNGSENSPFINALSRDGTGSITALPGKTLGPGESKLLITRVRPGSIVETMVLRHTGDSGIWRYFTIGTGLELIPVIASVRELIGDDLRTLPCTLQGGPAPNAGIEIQDNDLISLFANKHLIQWAKSILDSQLEYWNIHHIENYYHYMPVRPIGPEFARCIKAAPFWALARWKNHLFSDQQNFCMRRSPAGAVAFCIERIPRARRAQMLGRNPEAALRHGFDRLSDEELAVCVTAAPLQAMALARGFAPTTRARLLGSVVKHCTRGLPIRPTALQAAIFDSIVETPEAWLANFEDSFVTAFEKMDQNLGIRPSGEALIEFSKQFAPDKQARVLEVVANWI